MSSVHKKVEENMQISKVIIHIRLEYISDKNISDYQYIIKSIYGI